MTRASRPLRWASSMALAIGLVSGPARADVTKDQCIDANSKAQDLRRDGKLSAAREQLRTCATPSCPAMVRSDCTKRLDEVEKAQPTIAFEVKDASGADLSAVTLTMDGKPLADKRDGSALSVDPGQHVFTFAAEGQPVITRTLVLTEGEKGRRERIVVGASAPVSPAATPPVPLTTTPPPVSDQTSSLPPPVATGGGMSGQKVVGLVAGGAGVAALAVGAVFGVMTLSQVSQQKTDCASAAACDNRAQALSDHSTAMTDSTIATTAFIAGGALLVTGAVLFLTGGHPSEQRTGMLLTPSVGPGGAGIFLGGTFEQ